MVIVVVVSSIAWGRGWGAGGLAGRRGGLGFDPCAPALFAVITRNAIVSVYVLSRVGSLSLKGIGMVC